MDQVKQKAVEKVKDLLKLAGNTNHPEEAATAQRIAAKLRAQHNITEAELAEPVKHVPVAAVHSRVGEVWVVDLTPEVEGMLRDLFRWVREP